MITSGVMPVLPRRRVANPPRPHTSHDFAEALGTEGPGWGLLEGGRGVARHGDQNFTHTWLPFVAWPRSKRTPVAGFPQGVPCCVVTPPLPEP